MPHPSNRSPRIWLRTWGLSPPPAVLAGGGRNPLADPVERPWSGGDVAVEPQANLASRSLVGLEPATASYRVMVSPPRVRL